MSDRDPKDQQGVIVALMIGELRWQPTLNRISSEVVERAVEVWRADPSTLLICESELMRQHALRQGVPADRVRTALPQPSGHTTRLVAEWLSGNRHDLPGDPWTIVTHSLHAKRAVRILGRCGLRVDAVGVDAPFAMSDRDWKLRSEPIFRAYNAVAWVYCWLRGWV